MKATVKQFIQIALANVVLLGSMPAQYAFAKPEEGKAWVLSGYLPEAPSQKVYIKIQDRKIISKATTKPTGESIIETDAFIFPGIVDMHNHMEDGFLGLWNSARGQYLNRFEWRGNKEYQLAVKNNEAAFNGDSEATCATFRWAELKALAGGATAIQGSGSKGACVSDFGINNLEINKEFGPTSEIRSNLELVNPGNVKRVFLPLIRPKMKKGMSYDKALQAVMDETGVTKWVSTFKSAPRNLANGLKLAFGDSVGASDQTDIAKAGAEFDKLIPKIEAKAKTLQTAEGKPEFNFDRNGVSSSLNSYIKALRQFLIGDASHKSYLDPRVGKDDDSAYDFMGQGGNRTIGSMKRYLTMFEFGLKRGALNALKSKKASAFVTHLAEGMRNDLYNKEEFRIARDMGLIVPGMVLIHAVGMQIDAGIKPESASAMQSDYKYAAQNGVSLVWSPFSNLLLYGETMDIAEARASGINVAMGVDWSPTGSKNILDELKIARRYIDQQLTRKDLTAREKKNLNEMNDKVLTEMVTTNAYKALGISNLVGKIEPGFQADLTLIAKTAMNKAKSGKTPYSAMVYGEQDDVSLVVVKGQPLYGDVDAIEEASEIFGDRKRAEELPLGRSEACKLKKAVRFPWEAKLDATAKRDLRKASELQSTLTQILAKNRNVDEAHRASLDALFTCEENSRTQYGARFKTFVEKEVSENLSKRESIRKAQNLNGQIDLDAEESN